MPVGRCGERVLVPRKSRRARASRTPVLGRGGRRRLRRRPPRVKNHTGSACVPWSQYETFTDSPFPTVDLRTVGRPGATSRCAPRKSLLRVRGGDRCPRRWGRCRRWRAADPEFGPPPAGRPVAEARAAFLDDEPVPSGTVRAPILASWTRSRLWRVRPEHIDLPFEPGADGDSILTRAAEPVLREIVDLFATEPVSVILCDSDGVVLSRRTGDSGLEHHLDRVWLAPGFSYAEQFVGTNGIGTALEARSPAQVFGHEHYARAARRAGLRGRADPAPRHRQGARRRRPDLLAAGRRSAAGRDRGHAHPADRGDAAGAVRGARARGAQRLPARLPAGPRPGLRHRRRPADDERPCPRAARSGRPAAAAGRGTRGAGRRATLRR